MPYRINDNVRLASSDSAAGNDQTNVVTPVVSVSGTTSTGTPSAQGSLTDKSGTITAGGTQQTLAAADTARRYLFIQNQSSGDLWFNFGTNAVVSQPSIRLQAGESFTMEGNFVDTRIISIIGATTGQAFAAKVA